MEIFLVQKLDTRITEDGDTDLKRQVSIRIGVME